MPKTKSVSIVSIEIKKLFGNLNHNIHLSESGITFMHGPNGCGKTSILKILDALFLKNFLTLFSVEFSEFVVTLSDNSIIYVNKIDLEDGSPYLTKKITIKGAISAKKNIKEISRIFSNNMYDVIDAQLPPFIRQIADDLWEDARDGELLTRPEVIGRFDIDFPDVFLQPSDADEKWFDDVCSTVCVRFIKTQRLYTFDDNMKNSSRRSFSAGSGRFPHRPEVRTLSASSGRSPFVPEAIKKVAIDLRGLILKRLQEHAYTAQKQDSSYPARLLKKTNSPKIDKNIISDRYKSINEKIIALINAGLMEESGQITTIPEKDIDKSQYQAMSLYLDDMEQKLSIFNDLLERINLFLEVVSTKLHGKKLLIDRKEGLRIERTHNDTDKTAKIDLADLSSGEQHQIVLFFDLIFSTSDKTDILYIIDEPEISLHVDWQRRFISDLFKVKKLNSNYFLIATHSPQIIGSHYDEAVALNGGILEEAGK